MSHIGFSRNDVVGEDPKQLVVLILTVTTVSIIAYIRTPVLDAIATSNVPDFLGIGFSGHLVGYVLLLAVATTIAAVHAYTNDGLLTSTAAIFLPLWAWQYGYLQTEVVTQMPLVESIALPGVIAVPVGASTYVLSRHLVSSSSDSSGSSRMLLGGNRALSRRVSTIVLATSIVGTVVTLGTTASWVELVLPLTNLGTPVGWAVLFGWFVVLCWLPYRGVGLYTNWFVLIVPQVLIGTAVWLTTDSQGGLFGAIGGVVFPTVVTTLVLGTTAYIVGVGLSHDVTRTTSPPIQRQ